jgi:hypothetical protein
MKRDPDLVTALHKLQTYGPARNRRVDHDLRTVVLTDDEAMALWWHIKELAE